MGVSYSGESLRTFHVLLYGDRHFSEYPWQYISYKVSICRPYQTSCTGCGEVILMGVSYSGESLRGFSRFMYRCMEIGTFQNIHGNTYLTRFPFIGHTRAVVLVVGK